MEGIMVCETAWDEPPEYVVFKGHGDWPTYTPERFATRAVKPNCIVCSECHYVLHDEWLYCPHCGAKVW